VESNRPPDANLESREPTLEDLRDLCRALNEREARDVVIGWCFYATGLRNEARRPRPEPMVFTEREEGGGGDRLPLRLEPHLV
jgi:hypothetical protein